jgi:hypothetical protein
MVPRACYTRFLKIVFELAEIFFFFVYFFGGLECVGHSFAYVAHL